MNQFSKEVLSYAVDEVYSEIETVVKDHDTQLGEGILWRELSCCILSSQVSYDLAKRVAETIDQSKVLTMDDCSCNDIAENLHHILCGFFTINGRQCRYRFPVARSYQIARSWRAIRDRSASISEFLSEFEDADVIREWLVRNAPGLGPKQSSMFLRNVGHSLDLAVLDRHVLHYMETIELLKVGGKHAATIQNYKATESVLRNHADKLGYCLGYLDWAIWIVMRVAKSRYAVLGNIA